MKKFYFLLAVVVFYCCNVVAVSALGVGVKPKEINLDIQVNKKIETEILVMNVAQEPALYQVYPDALEDEIKIYPENFQLGPEGSQIVKVVVEIRNPGKFATNLSIVARPPGAGGLPTATGVKVPITISAAGLNLWRFALAVVIGICLLMIFVVKLKKDNSKL